MQDIINGAFYIFIVSMLLRIEHRITKIENLINGKNKNGKN